MGKGIFMPNQNKCRQAFKKYVTIIHTQRFGSLQISYESPIAGVGQQTITESPRKFVPVRGLLSGAFGYCS